MGTKEHFEKKAEQSRKNKTAGGQNVKVDLRKKILVRFTREYGYNKVGTEQYVSETAYEIYNNAGVIEKVN